MEILAPAGGPEALAAALEAGADAVYFGLKKLNARQGAANFPPSRLAGAVALVHARRAKAYLTLNIDLCQRELGEAARTLELARQAGVDGVLVKDPALLAMKRFFPELPFHFSTQAGISASPGVAAARELGISRVVLARELSKGEIDACCRVSGMEIEVFVQGAMCFSCSGRCLLSSWIGGRSGNRGACASPCRFLWHGDGIPEGSRPFSMHDLCLLEHLPELARSGVRSLKIEGRLKTAPWVRDAVRLYRDALDGSAPLPELRRQAETLGEYTGRRLTDAFFQGRRSRLTGEAARPANTPEPDPANTADAPADAPALPGGAPAGRSSGAVAAEVEEDGRNGLVVTWRLGGRSRRLRVPPQRIADPRRALPLAGILSRAGSELGLEPPPAVRIPEGLEGRLLPRRLYARIRDDLKDFLRSLAKEEDGSVRIPIPPGLRALVSPPPAGRSGNPTTIGEEIRHVRLGIEEAGRLGGAARECRVFFAWRPADGPEDGRDAQRDWLERNLARIQAVALPETCYEEELPAWEGILGFCRERSLPVEVNSWEGWELARRRGLPLVAGPGLAVLNSLAAGFLQSLGCAAVAVSPEIDRRQLEDLCGSCAVPLYLTVFGRPVLLRTRVEDAARPGRPVEDQRQTRMVPRRAGSVVEYRPERPVDWRGIRNPGIRVAGLVADLRGSADPARDWTRPAPPGTAFLFNYDRGLR